MTPKRLLIVEDDKMICTIFEMFIKELGHELVGIAQNGTDAVDKCRLFSPDIVLMDIHLAGEMSGIETARKLNALFPIPVIYISSDMEDTTIQNAICKNTYGFLVKPIYKVNLGITIEFAFAKHKCDQEFEQKL